ncbi:hypothetical protein ACJX0J_030827, partial [Zea mays]
MFIIILSIYLNYDHPLFPCLDFVVIEPLLEIKIKLENNRPLGIIATVPPNILMLFNQFKGHYYSLLNLARFCCTPTTLLNRALAAFSLVFIAYIKSRKSGLHPMGV